VKNKKGNFGLMQGAALAFVVVGILLVVGLQIMGDVQDDLTADSSEYNASVNAVTGLSDLAGKLPLIATVVGAVVVLVFVFLIARKSR
jgi:hypothetical protein